MSIGTPSHARHRTRADNCTSNRRGRGRRRALAWILACWITGITAASALRPGPVVHTAAVGAHLAYLALGFGLVLVVDLYALGVLVWRFPVSRMAAVAENASPLIFGAWAGLVASGALLHPHLDSALTQTKLAAVLAIAVNGLYVEQLRRNLGQSQAARPPAPLCRRALIAGVVSQAAWLTAILIGWHNSTI